MKLSLFLFCLTLLQVSAVTYPQKITVKTENVRLVDLLSKIEAQSQYKFLYEDELVQTGSKLRVDVNNKSITEVLDEILSQVDLKYTIFEDNLVVISRTNKIKMQQIAITGKITDAVTGEPLVGVNIILEGTTVGAVSDANGNYSIEVPGEDAVLVFSYIGYTTEKITVGGQTIINFTLAPDIESLEEVVVIGYGTQRKADVTSSVATVKSDDFIKGSVMDAGQLIQGKVAGLTVIMPTGDPTEKTQILLRGNTSLMGENQDPLVLIDGIPGDVNTVAPQDIETIDVLKDGSAAAIYGTRGTNGVIIITTKKAGTKKSSVEYSAYISTQNFARKLDLSSASDFRAQLESGDRIDIIDGTPVRPMDDNGASTDWLKELSQNPLSHNHNLTIRNSNETTNFTVNVNYNDRQGVFKKSYNKTFTGHIDVNHSMFNDRLKVNVNLFNSSSNWWGFNYSSYYQALQQNPTSPVKNPDGTWFQELAKFSYQNPVSDLYEHNGKYNNQIGRYKGSIIYTPIDGLKFSGVFSYSRKIEKKGYAETKQNVSTLRDNRNGYANIEGNEIIDRLAELTVEYSKVIDKHRFMILGGYSYQDNDHDEYYMENWDFPTDNFGWDNIELGRAVVNGEVANPMWSNRWKTNLIGFFGRFIYNFNDKYLLMASIRREEASQLWGTEDPWGTFPAVSAGWRITNESFMSNQTLFDDIKLRVGYGITGSQPSDLFKGVGILGYGNNIYSDGKWIKALVPTQNANPNLKWEEKHETDIGLDFSMLDDRISGSFDYYYRDVRDLLWLFDVPSPPNLYNRTLANVGVMENKGVEIMLNIVPIKNASLNWNTSIGYSTNTNKLKSLSNDIYELTTDYIQVGSIFPPIQTFSHVLEVGGPVGNFYGYKVIDIGSDPADEENYGQWIYEGADGEPVNYTDFAHGFGDKKVIGNGLPKFYLSWDNNIRYKNFDLNITQRGAFGFQVANLSRMMFENPEMKQYNLLNTAFDPIFGKDINLKSIPEFNSYYIEDGDFWKIDNITLGYSFNKIDVKYVKSLRIYASVLNAFIITGYKGIDPEVSLRNDVSYVQSGVVQVPTSGLNPGMDSPNNYPTTRTYTVGLNVSF